jgi:Xaa-Pro aminopeptidase
VVNRRSRRGSPITPIDEFARRREAISMGLAQRKADALLVSFSPNLRYLSGFTGSNGNLLILAGGAILFTDPRYEIQAPQEASCEVRIAKGPLVAEVVTAIARLRLRRIAYEPGRMTCETHQALESKLPVNASLVAVNGWVEQLRMVKTPAEIARIRKSVETNSMAFEQTVPRIREGMREQDLAAELEYRMRRLGAEKPSFDTIVASGDRSALPHAQPTSARLKRGDLVVVDMGALEAGYCSDMTRMLFVGAPGAKAKRAYRAVLEAQLAAIEAVRAGARTAKVDAEARKVLKAYDLDRAFVHSTGHGLGLEIHEPPRLGKKDKGRLQTGMAITIEPGVYLEGFGGIRIEDTVVVTEKGCEILTPTPKDLRLV